jgi:hypothetical protein
MFERRDFAQQTFDKDDTLSKAVKRQLWNVRRERED